MKVLAGPVVVLATLVGMGASGPVGRTAVPLVTTTPAKQAVDSGQPAVFQVKVRAPKAGQRLTGVTVSGLVKAPDSAVVTIGPNQTSWTCATAKGSFRCTKRQITGSELLVVAVKTVRQQFLDEVTLTAKLTSRQASGTAAAGTVTLRGAPGGVASVDNQVVGPARTWSKVVFPVTVNAAPNADGYYFAREWYFSGPGAYTAYMGVQPRPNGRMGLRFSVFGDGTRSAAAGCDSGADGGQGTTCSLEDLPLVHGHQYDLTVARDAVKPGATRAVWRGTARDVSAQGAQGRAVQIGAWSVPVAWGEITGDLGGFVEHYGGVMECRQMPFADITFGAPVVNGPAKVTASGYSYGLCGSKVHYKSTISGGRQRVTVGRR